MGVFEHFPYTNYHELNLDWILSKIKEMDTGLYDKVAKAVENILSNGEALQENSGAVKRGASGSFISTANYAPFEIYEIMKSYLDNTDKLFYGSPSFVGYNYDSVNDVFTPQTINGKYDEDGNALFPIVCVTLVQLALMGVAYENCRINTGNVEVAAYDGVNVPRLSGGENIPFSGQNNITLASNAAMQHWGNSGHGSVYSANFAKFLDEAGLLHRITNSNFTELSPGDVLFYQTADALNRWNGIGHCDVFFGWSGNNMVVISTDSKASPVIKYVKYNYKGSSFLPGLKWFARIPKPGNPGAVKNLASYFGNLPHTFSTENNSTMYIPLNPGANLEPNRAYTAIVEFADDWIDDSDSLYFNIVGYKGNVAVTGASSQIFKDNHGQRYGHNKYYCLFVMPSGNGDVDAVRLGAYSGGNNYSVTVTKFALYDKVVNPAYPGVDETVNNATQKAEILHESLNSGANIYYTIKNGILTVHGRFSVTAAVSQYAQLFKISGVTKYGNTTGDHRLTLYGTNGISILKLDPTTGVISLLGSSLTPGTTYVVDAALPIFLA